MKISSNKNIVMSKAMDLSHIYSLRNNFTIIGLTGQIGSGCSEVASQLEKGYGNGKDYEDPFEIGFDELYKRFKHNSFRKYRIIYNYAKFNFKSYTRINYKDVLVLFLLKNSFDQFIEFLKSDELTKVFEKLFENLKSNGAEPNFEIEIEELSKLKEEFNLLSEKFKKIETPSIDLYNFYFHGSYKLFCEKFHSILKKSSKIKRNKLLQTISINLRMSGEPYRFSGPLSNKAYTIVELINDIIKSHRKFVRKMVDEGQIKEERTQIVIDDLRNPIEIMYFKQRFSAYYTIAVNRDQISRNKVLSDKYMTPDTKEIREAFWEEEHNGGSDDEFFKAKISSCIQHADIHISFLTEDDVKEKNRDLLEPDLGNTQEIKITTDKTSPYFSWKMQLLKYVSLISQPGLVTPSPEERCMQMAYTAKHNSGCISRHVGATITDENYSVKAIGWNNTPSGQVPCVLRNADDIMYTKNDMKAFTDYETYNEDFRNALIENFANPVIEQAKNLKGRNVCFCFKDVKNSCSDGKNQVHTRSLHAEESAFLQISKYGGIGIQNGKLFTTASPCELCAKKAYQLGIKVIYYIDPYPGISFEHILKTGDHKIEIRLFNGAIGSTYHWLYDPIMPYKDEMTLLLGNKIYDYATKQKKMAEDFEKKIMDKEKRIKELEHEIQLMKNKK